MSLYERIIKVKTVLNDAKNDKFSFNDLAEIFGEGKRDAYIIDNQGFLLGYSLNKKEDCIFGDCDFAEKLDVEKLLALPAELYNMASEAMLKYIPTASKKLISVLPININQQCLGAVIFASDVELTEADMIFCEQASTIAAIEIISAETKRKEIDAKQIAIVEKAINTLSYSELEAVKNIVDELDSDEGILVASRIADRAGITRSVIVNALRKLESAGVITSHSLGMKGTRIKILNEKLRLQLQCEK